MKILLLACLAKNKSGNTFGGAEKSIINLANWLAEKGHIVTLASVQGCEQSFQINDKVDFKAYKIKEKRKIFVHIQMMKNTWNAIRYSNPDVIIGFWIHPMFYALLSRNGKKCINVYSERNDPNLEYSVISKIFRNYVMKNSSGIVFQTQNAQHYFNSDIIKKSVVIHNPVYISKEQYALYNDGKHRIVSVGRLNKQKNYSLLINAFSKLSDKYPEYILEIYGEGPLRTELQETIDLYKLNSRILLPGAFPDVIDKIYGAEIFVLPSLYEGMPNSLMEAMALGIPVIASDCPCGGPKELIENENNGFLFEVNNEEDLINKIEHVIRLHNKINLQNNEKNICITHSRNTIFAKWLEYITALSK